MNTQTPPGVSGRSPFEDAPLEPATTPDMAFSTDELSHPEYVNDDFRMFTFKVMKCPKRYVHDWRSCPFAHPTENARRRDPREVKYMPVPCPDYKRGLCLMGDACTYSHGVYECWLHPAKYRTQLCKDGGQCRRPVCFFAHSVPELRSPTYTWDGSEQSLPDGKQASTGLPDGALPHAGSGPGESEAGHGAADPAPLGYSSGVGKNTSAGFPFQQQQQRDSMRQAPLQDHLGQSHGPPAYYGYPPPQTGPYRDAYYTNQAIDPFTGMPMHPGLAQPHQAQASPFQVPMMGGVPGGLPGYQQAQQAPLQSMQRFHSQQLPPSRGPHHIQRQHSGMGPAGSLTSSASARSGVPSSDLGDLFASGGSGGNSAPRMSNAMARSLGLVPPKETRTRTLGALAGMMQGPRPTALAEGLQRPQLSYSLPAQLPDPDQQMRDVYLAAQASAQQTNTSSQVAAQRQGSVGLPQAVIRPGSAVGSMQRQASSGLPQRTPSMTPQRQSSMGLPPGMGQGNLGVPQALQDIPQDMHSVPYNTNPQDVRAWQLGVQQGVKGLQALQQELQAHPEAVVHKLQHELDGKSNDVLRQLQELGHDGAAVDPRQLQRLASMLSKQGVATRWPPQTLSSQTIPEAEQVTEGLDNHHLASLLQSLQAFNLQQPDNTPPSAHPGQQHTVSPFAAPEHAPAVEVFEGGERARSGGSRQSTRRVGSAHRAASGSSGSAPSAHEDSLPLGGLGSQSPFASPNQQLHKSSPASSLNSQSFQRHTSSPGLP